MLILYLSIIFELWAELNWKKCEILKTLKIYKIFTKIFMELKKRVKSNFMFDAYIFDKSIYHKCVYTYIIKIFYYIFNL